MAYFCNDCTPAFISLISSLNNLSLHCPATLSVSTKVLLKVLLQTLAGLVLDSRQGSSHPIALESALLLSSLRFTLTATQTKGMIKISQQRESNLQKSWSCTQGATCTSSVPEVVPELRRGARKGGREGLSHPGKRAKLHTQQMNYVAYFTKEDSAGARGELEKFAGGNILCFWNHS